MSTDTRDPIAISRPGEFGRKFVPEDIDLGDWEQLEPLLHALQERQFGSPVDLEQWLFDLSELEDCLQEEGSRRYIAMTCHTDDEELQQRHLHWVTEIVPRLKPLMHALSEKHLAAPQREVLPRDRYEVYDRSVKNAVELFREENVPLQTEEQRLENEHHRITGAQMVEFRGETRTMPQMAKFLEETDRATREEAWVGMAKRRLQDADALSDLFDKMLDLRGRMATNAGFESYLHYQHRRLERFDYAPADCEAFHTAVERVCVPATRHMAAERRERMGLDTLRPWDTSVDPLGRPPLRPFEGSEALVNGCRQVFEDVAHDLAERFDVLITNRLLDLESRPSKAPGGYQSTLTEVRLPFIFMNAAGTNRDVFTLLHEGGHAFHALAARCETLHAYRHAPIEFCEVASMGMEQMALDHLGAFYQGEMADRARRQHLETVIRIFPWIAQIDAFQHWLYSHPGHSRDERLEAWLALNERFGTGLDWSGHEDWLAMHWQSQLHLFQVPLYYIEYGIAQMGAVQLWLNFRRDPAQAVRQYQEALALGGSRPLPELFEAAGLRFDLSETAMRPLIDAVMEELASLPA